ncbi:MAG: ImmA/IrrE family metallo-endopeptidase [Nitrospira sp.]|nr:ImmA/IrrE family metallo-endopeptidase [Nitrospira sp.]
MVKLVPDRTGRFAQRPHYEPEDLDRECEGIINAFLQQSYNVIQFPVSTSDLTRLIERDADDLDPYADLSEYGSDVEGLTEFFKGRRPCVKISSRLSEDPRLENRLRTTLTHEYGHVHFHAYLWELEPQRLRLFGNEGNHNRQICKRDTMLDAAQSDWMEWQAGYICGALLMPLTVVRKLVEKYQESHGLYGIVGTNDSHGRNLIEAVQSQFQVSADAARVRLTKLKLIGQISSGPSLFSR